MHDPAELSPARNERSSGYLMSAGELLDLDLSGIPSRAPVAEAVRDQIVALLELPRPGCDVCGRPATEAHLKEDGTDAFLACQEHDPGEYYIRLDELADPSNEWAAQLGEKSWGLPALMWLLHRLTEEETIRQLREARESKS
jgi:hypothetical protein